MRLLSFLSDIEKALITESPVVDGGAWESTRMVNFYQGMARLSLTPRAGADVSIPAGSIFLQSFVLADGSMCLKANLTWKGSDAFPILSVYSTPTLNWKVEASRIAATWLEGPPAVATVSSYEHHAAHSLTAVAS